jgi:glycosyltransferase involved in cell wall biosynthesis
MPAMFSFDRPLASSLIRPLDQQPVLTVVVPTFERPVEMALAVTSIADQVDASLDGKVEIIITDNASGPETEMVLKQLAETYPFISYYVHAQNEGGDYQIFSAPHRARGRWTWVFGDDDFLGPGALKPIVALLETEQPGFVTLNRQVWNKTLDQCLTPSKHDLPDLRFDSFLELLRLFGFDQLSFLTSQIYLTEAACKVDTETYFTSHCRYCQLAYYLEACHDLTAYYMSQPYVWHRWDPGAGQIHAANFHHLATLHPVLVQYAAGRVGIQEADLFENIGGRRSLVGPEQRRITFTDNILENLWRSVALGTEIPEYEWERMEPAIRSWSPERTAQLQLVREVYVKVYAAFQHFQTLVNEHKARKPAIGNAFTPAEIDMIQQSEAAIMSLQGNINDARKMAFDMASGFS